MSAEQINKVMARLFLISGRMAGDDDDTVHLVEASSLEVALSHFSTQLREDSNAGEDEKVFIITAEPLQSVYAARMVASPFPLPSRGGWEREIIEGLTVVMEISNGDAQGIVEANSFVLAQEWAKGTSAAFVVAKLCSAS